MNRVIKFRAWYKGKMYRYVEHVTYPDGSSGTDCIGDSGCMISPDDSQLVLMQYTGLKDKNGKEVYEGDIVVVRDWYSKDHHYTTTIRHEEGSWNYSCTLSLYNQEPSRDWEVIGNIYEHSHLLDKENAA